MSVWGITGSPLTWGGVPEEQYSNATTIALLGNTGILAMHEAAAEGEGGLLGGARRSIAEPIAERTDGAAWHLSAVNVSAGSSGSTAAFVLQSDASTTEDAPFAWFVLASQASEDTTVSASWEQLGLNLKPDACVQVSDLWAQGP